MTICVFSSLSCIYFLGKSLLLCLEDVCLLSETPVLVGGVMIILGSDI